MRNMPLLWKGFLQTGKKASRPSRPIRYTDVGHAHQSGKCPIWIDIRIIGRYSDFILDLIGQKGVS